MRGSISGTERILRLVIGIVFIACGLIFTLSSYLTYLLYFVGAVLIIAACIGWCPCVCLFKKNSNGINKITQRDIEEAVKKYPIQSKQKKTKLETIAPEKPKKKKTTKKKTVKKSTPKKKTSTAKKTTSKKRLSPKK